MWDELLSVGVLLAQAQLVIVVIARVPTGDHTWSSGPRALAALLASLVVPASFTSWLLLASVPLWICKTISILLLLFASVVWLRVPGQRWSPAVWTSRSWWLVLPVVILTALTAVGAALKPEGSIDGLLYHGPQLANLLVKESLFGWESANEYVYYPGLQMVLLSLWMDALGPIVGEDVVQAPYVALAVLALYVASSQTSSYRLTRMWLSALVVASPVAWMQARILYVDVAAAALMVTAVVLTVFAIRARTSFAIVIGALAGGAALATKPSGLALGAVVIGYILVAGLVLRSRLVLLVPLVAAMAGLPFFLRNMIAFGNPIFPVGLKRGPVQLPGILDESLFYSASASGGILDPSRLEQAARDVLIGVLRGPGRWLYDPREGGFAQVPLAVLLVVAGVVLTALVISLYRAKCSCRFLPPGSRHREMPSAFKMWCRPDWVAGSVLVVALLGVALQPNAADSRYLLAQVWLIAGVVISIVSLVPDFTWVDRFWATVTAAAVVLLIFWMESVMLFGIKESIVLRYGPSFLGDSAALASYNTGVTGTAVAYGDNFLWLGGEPCAAVIAESGGGLTPAGMSGMDGVLTTFQYPLWGDQLCNEVRFYSVTDADAARGWVMRLNENSAHEAPIFLISNSSSALEWEGWLASQGIPFEVVYRTPAVDEFTVEEVVLRIPPR